MKDKIFFFVSVLIFLGKTFSLEALTWDDIKQKETIYLYAGNTSGKYPYDGYIGLSLYLNDNNHIKHDITNKMLLPENCVDIYQSEDVFEHIEYEKLLDVIDDIFRVLKPNGLFRLSVPDYRFDGWVNRSLKDAHGNVIFDPGGGGRYINGKVVGGHVWFPIIENVLSLLKRTKFFSNGRIELLHYYDTNGVSVTRPIDYSKGYVKRTPDHDKRGQRSYRAMSIVIDLYKDSE